MESIEKIWNKYKEENLQMSAYMFKLHEKEYKKIFFDAFELATRSKFLAKEKIETLKEINRIEIIHQEQYKVVSLIKSKYTKWYYRPLEFITFGKRFNARYEYDCERLDVGIFKGIL